MKKLLTILGVTSITASSASLAVAYNKPQHQSEKNINDLLNANITNERNILFNNEMKTLNEEQHKQIINLISKNTINNDQVIKTDFDSLKTNLINLNFLSHNAIELICSKQIDQEALNEIGNAKLISPLSFRSNEKITITPYFGNERKFNEKGFKFYIRWSWYVYITGFWNIEADPELSTLISSMYTEGAGAMALIWEILAPVIIIPVVGTIIAGLSAAALVAAAIVWNTVNKDNGIYGDFVLLIPGKTVPSNEDWNKF